MDFVDDLVHVHGFQRQVERLPEVAEHLLPRQIAFLDFVELGLH